MIIVIKVTDRFEIFRASQQGRNSERVDVSVLSLNRVAGKKQARFLCCSLGENLFKFGGAYYLQLRPSTI